MFHEILLNSASDIGLFLSDEILKDSQFISNKMTYLLFEVAEWISWKLDKWLIENAP